MTKKSEDIGVETDRIPSFAVVAGKLLAALSLLSLIATACVLANIPAV